MVSLRNQCFFFALCWKLSCFHFSFISGTCCSLVYWGSGLRNWCRIRNSKLDITEVCCRQKFDVNKIWNRFDEIVKKWRWDADSLINSLWVVSIKPDWSQLLQLITGKPDVGGHAQGKAGLTSELSLIYLLCGNYRNPALARDAYASITAFRVV